MKKLIDKTLVLYLLLGIANYIVCNTVMLFINIVFSVPETPSLMIEFLLQTVSAFFLNRYVTFRGRRITRFWPLLSIGVFLLCFLIAKVLLRDVFYALMQTPAMTVSANRLQTLLGLDAEPEVFREKLVMLMCTLMYSILNYFGQRYLVFRPLPEASEEPQED